jgi:chitin synthase
MSYSKDPYDNKPTDAPLQPVRTTSRQGPGVSFSEAQHPRHAANRQNTNDSFKSSSAGGPPLPPKLATQQSSSGYSTSSAGLSQEPHLGYSAGTDPANYGQASQPHSHGLGAIFGVGQPGGLGGGASDVRRKKSLVKPDRERIDPNHRLWHYREHAAAGGNGVVAGGNQAGQGGQGGMDVLPSTTGNAPPGLRRGKSLLAREPMDAGQESGLNIFKRSATLRRKSSTNVPTANNAGQRVHGGPNGATAGTSRSATNYTKQEKIGCLGDFAPGPKDAWMVYCFLLTCCVPGFVLRGVFGESSITCRSGEMVIDAIGPCRQTH